MNLTHYNKAIVATVMGVLLIIEAWTGWKSDALSEQTVLTVIGILMPILVYFIPNTPT